MSAADTEDYDDASCIALVLTHKRECEDEWIWSGWSFAWIDEKPEWMGATDWNALIEDPDKPTDRAVRFSLKGGGQIRVLEKFRNWTVSDGIVHLSLHGDRSLSVAAHTE